MATLSKNTVKPSRMPPMKVVGLSLGRSGTTSLQAALRILGHQKVYHGWTIFEDIAGTRNWIKALDAKYHGKGKLMKGDDFDLMLAGYDAIAGDFPAAAFADELVEAYPEAKIIIVERDVEGWFASLKSDVFPPVFNPLNICIGLLDPQFMGPICRFWRTVYFGHFDARSPAEVATKAMQVYKEHYKHVRSIVPPERLLDFKLADGWAPLCGFLGKDIPDMPFPRLNENGAMVEVERTFQRRGMGNILRNISAAVLVVAASWWMFRSIGARVIH